MSRFRKRYLPNDKHLSTQKSSTGITLSSNDCVDVRLEQMLDGTIPIVKTHRPRLSDSVRVPKRNKTPEPYRRWPFHHLQYTASSQSEPVTSWTAADTPGGARKWAGQGCFTQFLLSRYYTIGVGTLVLPSWPSVPSLTLSCDIEAVSKAMTFLDRPKLSLGEPTAELRTFPKDIGSVLDPMDKYTWQYRKRIDGYIGSHKTLKHLPRFLADTWVRYAFFLGPLVRTAEDICTEYADRISAPDLWQTARGIHRIRGNDVLKQTSQTASGWTWLLEQRRHLELEVRKGIVFSSPDRTSSVPGRLGLVKRDLPVTTWELTPLSFFIDRVINVKRFIRSAITLSSPNVKISRSSFQTSRQSDVKLLRLANHRAVSTPGAFYAPSTTPWYRQEDFTFVRSQWWPELGELVATSRGTGLLSSLTKTADLASVILGRVT